MNDDLPRRLADHAAQIAALRRDLEAVKEMLERLLRRP
jgi:ubiquinone biosynthesis protein UbiJ